MISKNAIHVESKNICGTSPGEINGMLSNTTDNLALL